MVTERCPLCTSLRLTGTLPIAIKAEWRVCQDCGADGPASPNTGWEWERRGYCEGGYTATAESVLEKCRPIAGWMYDEELLWLFEQAAKSQLIFEIGVWKGRSTTALCMGSRKRAETTGHSANVICIDWFQGSAMELTGAHVEANTNEGREAIQRQAKANLKPWLENGVLFICPISSSQAAIHFAPLLAHRKIDMIFVDAGHTFDAVTSDLKSWLPLCREGGLICGHDYTWPAVKAAVDVQIESPQRGPGSIWYWRKEGSL